MEENLFDRYAFVGIGSNLSSVHGSPRDNVQVAVKELGALSDEPLLVSSLRETKPLDCPPGSPDFVNAVVGLMPRREESPEILLEKLQYLERKLGRVRSGVRNEARVIDLDLLTFHRDTQRTAGLSLPHPRLAERLFVLEPLLELVGDVSPPGETLSICELINKIRINKRSPKA